jgi:hypothetical protein
MSTCSSVTGALFCDFGNGLGSQYVPLSSEGDVISCVEALSSMFNASVSGGISCSGGTCTATGIAGINGPGGASCALSAGPGAPLSAGAAGTGGLLLGLGLVAGAAARRRRKAA